jgi:hypothetical protein
VDPAPDARDSGAESAPAANGPGGRRLGDRLDRARGGREVHPRLRRIGDAVPPFRFAARVVASDDARAVFARFLEDGIPPDTAYVAEKRPIYVTRDGIGKPHLALFA